MTKRSFNKSSGVLPASVIIRFGFLECFDNSLTTTQYTKNMLMKRRKPKL